MPASSGEISAAIGQSLASSSKFNTEDNLDAKLLGSAKRVLLTEIEYEQTSSYSSTVLDLKSKYIVLKPSTNLENGDLKQKENCDLKIKSVVPKLTSSDSPKAPKLTYSDSHKASASSASSTTPQSSPVVGSSKTDAVLPSPKKILYPPDKIQLGWQSKNVPIGSGMINLGNTCYLNSTLQALFHVPAFVNWLSSDKAHKEKCETMNGMTHTECLICAMAKTLKNSMENSASCNPIRPHLVYNKLKLICKRLIHGHQEDAHEFLRYLIESMDDSYLRIMQAMSLDSYSKETTPLSQIFGGYLRTEVRCLECRNISLTFQHFQDLALDIRQSGTLDDALDAYFARERLGEGEEAYKCEKCTRRVAATKQFTVEKPPNVLCIQLKRFGIMGGKNSKHISITHSLDLTKYWIHRSGMPGHRLNYRLVSMVLHIGPSSNCGHYTAIASTASGQFYLFDDSVVRPVSSHSVGTSGNTYIIMYELNSPNPSINGTPSKPVPASCTVTKPSQMNGSGLNGAAYANGLSSQMNGSSLHSPAKLLSQPSSPLKTVLSSPAKPASPLCTKSGSGGSPANKSLVPYSTESSDSESEPTTSKQKVSLALTPVKNGFAKESSSSVKYSNCSAGAAVCKTSGAKPIVNGWHVTEVSPRPSTVYSPPQNWDVVDTSTKVIDKPEESSQSKTSSPYNYNKPTPYNGIQSHRKPLENGYNKPPSYEDTRQLTNGYADNRRLTNGSNWDGSRNNGTVEYLRKNSHQGYGSNVSTWSGERSLMDRELDNERMQQRKRNYDQMYEDDFDQGKIKKVKNNHYQNNGDREMNGRRNYFQEHQNHKNWYNNKPHFYQYNNHNFRTYQNRNKFHWKR